MAATALSFADFKAEVGKRLDGKGFSQSDINAFFTAFGDELRDCLANGYKVSIPGIVSFTPVMKPGRRKGTKVANPFTGETKTLRADEPDKFIVKYGKSSALLRIFPSIKTATGQELAKALKPVAKKKKKAA